MDRWTLPPLVHLLDAFGLRCDHLTVRAVGNDKLGDIVKSARLHVVISGDPAQNAYSHRKCWGLSVDINLEFVSREYLSRKSYFYAVELGHASER